MNLTDRNKMIIAGGVAVVAILLVAFFVLRGRGPEEPAGGAGAFTQGEAVEVATADGAPAAPGAVSPGEAGGEVSGEAPTGPTVGPSVGVVQMGIGPSEPTRPDPFLSFEPPEPPTPPELLVSLPPVGVVAGGLRPGGITTDGPRVGDRRVAGLLFNDQAWAILEDESGETFIVKPGDVVDGIRITALSRNSIFLMDRDGMRWEVPLRGLGPGTTGGTVSSTVSAMPNMPPA